MKWPERILCTSIAVFSLLVSSAGCGGGGGGDSEMSVEVDGTSLVGSELSSGVDAAGNTVITGSGSDWSLEIRFPGTAVGDFSSDSSAGAEVFYTDAAGTIYTASDLLAVSSYTITISFYDTKRVEGSFSLTVVAPDGSTHQIGGSFVLIIPGLNSSNPYGATYIGIFKVQGQVNEGTSPDPPYDIIWGPMQTYGFRVTIKLDHLATAAGSAVYFINHANVADPFFGCQVAGCTPASETSVATLPAPPGTPTPSGPSQSGQGVLINFPNGSSLGTVNDEGALYTSTDARTLSNVLGLDQTWVSLDSAGNSYPQAKFGHIYDNLNPETRSMTWALTRSAL